MVTQRIFKVVCTFSAAFSYIKFSSHIATKKDINFILYIHSLSHFADFKERLSALTKELQTLRQIISENEQKAMEVAQESEKDNDESSHQEPVAATHHRSDAFLDILRKENKSLLRDLEQLRIHREQMKNIIEEKTHELERSVTKIAELTKELQDAKKELKTCKGKLSKLEGGVESREREVASLRDKVTKFKANEERMKAEIQTLIWKEQINQRDDVVQQSKGTETVDVEEGTSDGLGMAEVSKTAAMEDKLCQLSKENETLHEQIRYLREVNSALVENVKDKDDRLKLFYDEKQEQIKKEEARLERVESLLLENGRLKDRVQELENEAKTSSASAKICARCKQEIMSNEKPSQVNAVVDKEGRTDGEAIDRTTDVVMVRILFFLVFVCLLFFLVFVCFSTPLATAQKGLQRLCMHNTSAL